MSAGGGAVRRFAGPVGGVSLDVEGITGGGLQVPDDLLQSRLADGLLVLHLHRVYERGGGVSGAPPREGLEGVGRGREREREAWGTMGK